MKQRITYITYTLALTGLLAGLGACSDDNAQVTPTEGERTLTISYTIPGSEGQPRNGAQTRGETASGDDESAIGRLDLIFFNSDAHGDGSYAAHQTVTTAYNLKKNTFTVTPPAQVNEADAYQVLIIANLNAYVGSGELAGYCEGFETYNQAWNELRSAPLANTGGGGYAYPATKLLMSGTAVKPAGKSELNFELIRAAVRIDVKVKDGSGITLQNAELHNLPTTVPFFKTGEVEAESDLYVKAASTAGNAARLYTFENILDVTDPLARINRAVCLLLQANKTSSGYGNRNWYRVDLNIVNNIQQLKRNHVYTVTLTEVAAAGAATREEAYNSVSFLPATVTVSDFSNGGTYTEGEFEFQ